MEERKRTSTIFKVIYGLLLVIALVCVAVALINPEKILQVYPYPGSVAHLYSDAVEPGGTSSVVWADRGSNLYECEIRYGIAYPYCGVVIKYKRPESENFGLMDYFEYNDALTLDLSSYKGLYVSVEYTGPSSMLYLFMRSAPILPKNSYEYDLLPYLHVDFQPGEDVFIDFSRVLVARWWIDKYDPPNQLRLANFNRIFELGFELPASPEAGAHRVKINRIYAKKSYVLPEHLFLVSAGMLGIGFLVLIIQLVLRYFAMRYYQENETLRTTMAVDPLTRCFNRIGLAMAVKKTFPLEHPANIFVMVLDLDHFKRINDTLGHVAGDEVLRTASEILAKELRNDDVLGRWGGEEFVIISKINRDALDTMISRLMRSLRAIHINGAPTDFALTMSVGVAEAQVGESFDDVFKRADEAMYKVKQAGRGSWQLA
jgi:diguanylate cyclase (GGDEF) domain